MSFKIFWHPAAAKITMEKQNKPQRGPVYGLKLDTTTKQLHTPEMKNACYAISVAVSVNIV